MDISLVTIVRLSKHMTPYSGVLTKICTTKQRTSGVILLMVGTSYPALMKFDVYCSNWNSHNHW